MREYAEGRHLVDDYVARVGQAEAHVELVHVLQARRVRARLGALGREAAHRPNRADNLRRKPVRAREAVLHALVHPLRARGHERSYYVQLSQVGSKKRLATANEY